MGDRKLTNPGNAEPLLGPNGEELGEAGGIERQRGWYSRGYLPHADFPGLLQMITYRLADSLPAEVLARIEDELHTVHKPWQQAERRRRIEQWLDSGHGACILQKAPAAECVVKTWQRFAGERYDLIAWVAMPNHVHVLIRVYEGGQLGKIVQSWKSYTGRRIAELGLGGPRAGLPTAGGISTSVWMREYWDRFIRDEKHFYAAIEYIHKNPVKARLVKNPEDWPWSSAPSWGSAVPARLLREPSTGPSVHRKDSVPV
ncbi:MAG: transposase [Dehalococcoidia bacterium]|nr:transposase [Dehalococcoidia bacterium]